jgi:hypothetical protein
MSSTDLPAGTTESGCTSDTISPVEGILTLALTLGMLVLAWITVGPTEEEAVRARPGS